MTLIIEPLNHSIMITGFVFVMMLVIEFVNVQTSGMLHNSLEKNKWKQYFFAAFLGVIPGCLGAFTAVALFSHRIISFGAIVTTMIATSGDEAFLMLAMFPQKAIFLTGLLFIIAIFAGFISDKIIKRKTIDKKLFSNKMPLHTHDKCKCMTFSKMILNLRKMSFHRFLIILIILILFTGTMNGYIAGEAKLWVKISILLTIIFSLFIAVAVPDHFLEKHLWEHIVRKHIPRIFIWTFGVLFLIHFAGQFVDVEKLITNNTFLLIIIAALVGLIPESGPHLIFVTLFASGNLPFSVLLASSIVQDGHGMIPMLAESKKSYFAVKSINLIVGIFAGSIVYFIGF